MPNPTIDRTQQRQLQREYNRLTIQAKTGYRELEKRCDELTADLPRRTHHLVKAVITLWKRRGSQHVETFLGPTALEHALAPNGRPWQSGSSHKRAKREVFDVWCGPEGQTVEGRGILRRTHIGGGRLARREGGGRNSAGRFRGNADGVMPGPEITGWGEEQYRRVKLGPPPAPAEHTVLTREDGESAAAFRDRIRRHEAYLLRQGVQMADGP